MDGGQCPLQRRRLTFVEFERKLFMLAWVGNEPGGGSQQTSKKPNS